MRPRFRIRYADAPMAAWEGESATDDFDEALSLLREFCAHYDVVDFQMRCACIEDEEDGNAGC